MKCLVAFILLFTADYAFADERRILADEVIEAAAHAYADERRYVEISGCEMVTYRWRNRPNHGWVLWTSFQFDMRHAQLVESTLVPGEKFLYATTQEGPPEIGFGIIRFEMKPDTQVRQERSILREHSTETTPSPRNDGSSHYYEYIDEFIFTLEGPDVHEKMSRFTLLYDQYVRQFCTFVG